MNAILKKAVYEIMEDFASKSKVFINEAHLQYEFTLELASRLPCFEYHLEFPIKSVGRADLVVVDNHGKKYVFEFKYKTKMVKVHIPPSLTIWLKNHLAWDITRYSCWRDISKIEKSKTLSNDYDGGFFLLITNDENLILPAKNGNQDEQFDISEGKQPSFPSPLCWKDLSMSTAKKYPNSIKISRSYLFHYESYDKPNDRFKYIIVEIK